MKYAFEGILVNEFHTLNGLCASLVPSGPEYAGVSLQNQVCTTVGSNPGQDRVNGNTFVGISYNYSYSHLWRVSIRCPSELSHKLNFLNAELRYFMCFYDRLHKCALVPNRSK